MTDTDTTPTPAPDDRSWRGLGLQGRLTLEIWPKMVDRYVNPSEAADAASRYARAIMASLAFDRKGDCDE